MSPWRKRKANAREWILQDLGGKELRSVNKQIILGIQHNESYLKKGTSKTQSQDFFGFQHGGGSREQNFQNGG